MNRSTYALLVALVTMGAAGCQAPATTYSVSAHVARGEEPDTYKITAKVSQVAQDGKASVLTSPTMLVRESQSGEIIVSDKDDMRIRVHGRVVGDARQTEAEVQAEVLDGSRCVWKSSLTMAIDSRRK